MQCQGNLRQLGMAMSAFVADNDNWPSGSISQMYPANPANPYQLYRWSALAVITPYLQEYDTFEALNFDIPLYNGLSGLPTPENSTAINRYIGLFMCPSDRQSIVNYNFAPTNYAVCNGTGLNGGAPDSTSDGIFYINSNTRPIDVWDGTANTLLMSESLLGDMSTKASRLLNSRPTTCMPVRFP